MGWPNSEWKIYPRREINAKQNPWEKQATYVICYWMKAIFIGLWPFCFHAHAAGINNLWAPKQKHQHDKLAVGTLHNLQDCFIDKKMNIAQEFKIVRFWWNSYVAVQNVKPFSSEESVSTDIALYMSCTFYYRRQLIVFNWLTIQHCIKLALSPKS